VDTPVHRPPTEDARAGSGLHGFLRWLRKRWPVYVSIWLMFGLYLGINQIIGIRKVMPELPRWEPITWELSSVVVIMLLIPLIVGFEHRYRVDARPRWRTLGIHALGAVAFSLVHTTGMVLIRLGVYAIAGAHYDYGNPLVGWVYELQKDVVTYLTFLGAIFAFREFRIRRAGELHAAELAAELTTARLSHLTTQVEPHFLFNALNAISNRMHEDVEAADRMIAHLGDLLRAAYDSDGSVLVPLGRELEWLRGYAAMMSERFRGQLRFELEVDPGLETVRVPRLLLQPLVENALKHGLRDAHGTVRIEVRRDGARIAYSVSDDGVGLPDTGLSFGTGLSNIARRLQLLFPGAHTFTLDRRSPGGAVARIAFPVSD